MKINIEGSQGVEVETEGGLYISIGNDRFVATAKRVREGISCSKNDGYQVRANIVPKHEKGSKDEQ